MAVRWSSETVVAEYRELQANAMGVDSTGQVAVLAGRRCLAIINLDRPEDVVKKYPRQSKWEVTTAEWNPTVEKQNMFAIACNQRAELQVCRDNDVIVQNSLRAHTRVISDLNWSPFDSNLIATCSVDTFIHLWDIRDARRPVTSLCAVAGASQVKWNKARNNLLATSHDGDVRLWDHRKNNSPFQYIAAHLSKIHGLDWSPVQGQEFFLATSSQDCTVKFWDVADPCRTLSVLASGSPVWRARYTPFGEGLITVVVPQLRRGENSLLLWSTSNLLSPVHTFVGHTDVVLEFEWRQHCEESKDFQLVTWSKDQSLRIWRIDSQLQKLCGHDVDLLDDLDRFAGVESSGCLEEHATNNSAAGLVPHVRDGGRNCVAEVPDVMPGPPLPAADVGERHARGIYIEGKRSDAVVNGDDARSEVLSPLHPKNLQQEFVLLNRNIPNVRVEEMDNVARTCIVSATSGKLKVRLTLTFPISYPYNSPPTFHFCKGTSASNNVKNELSRVLQTACQQHVKKNMPCLEPCLRLLVSTLESCVEPYDNSSLYVMEQNQQTFQLPHKIYGSFQDCNIPFPRTCGATFCGAGYLVCFMRPPQMKGLPSGPDMTPRSLSGLAAYATNPMQSIGHPGQTTPPYNLLYPPVAQSPTGDPSVSITQFYYQDRRQRPRGKLRKEDVQYRFQRLSRVVFYDVSDLLPICKELAQVYRLDNKDLPGVCTINMTAALHLGRKDLVQLWSLATLTTSPCLKPSSDPNCGLPWARHPFGRKLLQSLILHYEQLGDVQTVAMLCCIFSPSTDQLMCPKKPCTIPDIIAYPLSGKWWLKPGGSPYHTIHPGDTVIDGYSLGALMKSNRSNSWSDCLDDCDGRQFSRRVQEPKEIEREKHENNIKLLDPKKTHQYDEFKRAYADILYQWGLLEARAEVLKYVSTPPEQHRGIEFLTECQQCQSDVRGAQCGTCKNYSLQCCICHISVKGSFNFCTICGHGGHARHLMEWFQVYDYCPEGCGCSCLTESLSGDSTL